MRKIILSVAALAVLLGSLTAPTALAQSSCPNIWCGAECGVAGYDFCIANGCDLCGCRNIRTSGCMSMPSVNCCGGTVY